MNYEELIPKLVRAALDDDRRLVEEISTMMIKATRKSNPNLAKDISQSLTYSRNGDFSLRSLDIQPSPVDKETRYSLAKTEEPIKIEVPVLAIKTFDDINNFLMEREKIEELLIENILPPKSMLFIGAPGVGKTYTAKWIAYKLNMPLVTIDLATTISSYLGRSGQNIKSIFDYARSFPCILFLDELDAIAKKRDDASDLGELKRLVNVLLKEMEDWPSQSIIIAATNHSDLLDKAIWRRFDRIVMFDLPEKEEKKKLLKRYLDKYYEKLDSATIDFLVNRLDSISAADIYKNCEHIKRRILMNDAIHPDISALEVICAGNYLERQDKIEICNLLKNTFPQLSVREISRITKIPVSSISRYTSKREG